jgi:hypothetical protein
MIFLRCHLHEELKIGYLTIKDPLILWKNLKERYNHQKTVILLKTRYNWIHLRLQDFKSGSKYNFAMFNISSKLKLCGDNITDDDMLEKIFSTSYSLNMLLQQQYRERGFKKYSELITCLLVVEQNNKFLMKNHKSRPTGSASFPEVNATGYNNNNYGCGHNRGRGCGHERRRFNYCNYNGCNSSNSYKPSQSDEKQEKRKDIRSGDTKKIENACYRCEMKGYWSRICHMTKHLVDLYQSLLKGKEKNIEIFFSHPHQENDDIYPLDMTHLDIVDFFEQTNEKINISHNDNN